MRIVCSVGLRAGPELVRQIFAVTAPAQPELVLVRVIDTGPRKDLEQISGPLHFGPRREDPRRGAAIDAAEEAAGRVSLDEALAEARAAGVPAEARLARGKPEQVIVAVASGEQAQLVASRAADPEEAHQYVTPADEGQ